MSQGSSIVLETQSWLIIRVKEIVSCKIVEHFIDSSIHGEGPLKYLKFIIVDRLNNVDDLSTCEIDEPLLEKEKLWICMN